VLQNLPRLQASPLHVLQNHDRQTHQEATQSRSISHDKAKESHGKGKGKDITATSVGKPDGKAHQLKKQTFNVCFFKAFGNKILFCHLVKMGPDNQALHELLDLWAEHCVKLAEKSPKTLQKLKQTLASVGID
jgi:hypothetical protein